MDYAYRFILLVPRLTCLNDVVTSFQRSIFVIFSVIDFDDGFEQTELSITGQKEGTLVLKFLVLKEKFWFLGFAIRFQHAILGWVLDQCLSFFSFFGWFSLDPTRKVMGLKHSCHDAINLVTITTFTTVVTVSVSIPYHCQYCCLHLSTPSLP